MRQSRLAGAFIVAFLIVAVTGVVAAFQTDGTVDEGTYQRLDRQQQLDEEVFDLIQN